MTTRPLETARALRCRLVPADGAWSPPEGEHLLALLEPAGVDGALAPPPGALRVRVPLRSLDATPMVEVWSSAHEPVLRDEGLLRVAETGTLAFGVLELEERNLEADVARLYETLLAYLDRSGYGYLVRAWNVVPHVNAGYPGAEEMDRYMAFCRARSLTFERHYGAGFEGRLCAASAVGGEGGTLVVYFLAAREPGTPVVNPRQEEAWRYPRRYGPRPPSFARGTRPAAPFDGLLLVSGTASIVGHESLYPGDVTAQTSETLRNLDEVARQGASDGVSGSSRWLLRVYLRDEQDGAAVRRSLESAFGARATVLFLRSDICRSDLAVEIEAVVSG